ncbi:hypothetical protein CENSYa_0314 [Cenarchaeum symbiosum A]|uniref:Haemin-degrading HemS/ChuX domain-containing protein n=1 Tax=Cenarchaeum symbiosum (strain A) TaxID=414004 RepID=A0RUD4_CENSY|nr:hypothetical protein CENSYa_0314 [Cenarchaeum symbiosum A]
MIAAPNGHAQNGLMDLLGVSDILFIIRGGGAVAEIRSNSLGIRRKEQWITIGDNDGPCHMHIDSGKIASARFVAEEKPGRTSYSVRFLDDDGERVLGAFFTKMYDTEGALSQDRKALYDGLSSKYGTEVYFTE